MSMSRALRQFPDLTLGFGGLAFPSPADDERWMNEVWAAEMFNRGVCHAHALSAYEGESDVEAAQFGYLLPGDRPLTEEASEVYQLLLKYFRDRDEARKQLRLVEEFLSESVGESEEQAYGG